MYVAIILQICNSYMCIYILYFLVICVEITNTTVGKDLVTVEFRGTGPFTCQLDRQSSVPCSSPITYSRAKLLGGFHKVTITGANRTCMEITNFTLPCE